MNENKQPNVEITFFEAGQRQRARYVSDTTVLEEALDNTRLINLSWSSSGMVYRDTTVRNLPNINVLQNPMTVFDMDIDGQSLHNRWDWVKSSKRPGKRPGTVEAVIELRHQVRPVSVKVVTRLDGTPALVRYIEITNTGTVPAVLSSISPWSGLLWSSVNAGFPYNPSFNEKKSARFTLGYFYSEHWGREGDLIWQPLPNENFRVERQCHAHSTPYYIVKNEETGETIFIALEWSGSFFAEFKNHPETMLFFKIGPNAPAPLRVIGPGETVCSPAVHLAQGHGNMDETISKWYRHMRTSVVPERPKGKEMYIIGGNVVTEPGDWILKEMDIAKEMGIEAFMIDAGWYGDNFSQWPQLRGDWYEGNWLPGGLKGMREHAHKNGMLFGLWHEAETISKDSKLYKEHPDWVLTTDGKREYEGNLNLGKPEVAAFLEDTVIRIIRDYKLDFYKLDYNVSSYEGGQNLINGYLENESWRHCEVIYKVYDRVRKEFPDVCLENCASGGGRNDLGMVSRFHYCCESDWAIFPYSIRAINAFTLFIPPENLCYYHNICFQPGWNQPANLDTYLRVTLFAIPIFVGFGDPTANMNLEHFQKVRKYIELNKTFCRKAMGNHPVVYHHTPDIGVLKPADWCVLEYGTQDKLTGYAGIFKLSGEKGMTEYVFKPRGVNLSQKYKVIVDNSNSSFEATGRELANEGISVYLDSPLTSELIMFSAIEN